MNINITNEQDQFKKPESKRGRTAISRIIKNVLGGFTGGSDEGTDTDGCGIIHCTCNNGKPATIIACDEISCDECQEACDLHCS